jgi:hypothetical protein
VIVGIKAEPQWKRQRPQLCVSSQESSLADDCEEQCSDALVILILELLLAILWLTIMSDEVVDIFTIITDPAMAFALKEMSNRKMSKCRIMVCIMLDSNQAVNKLPTKILTLYPSHVGRYDYVFSPHFSHNECPTHINYPLAAWLWRLL